MILDPKARVFEAASKEPGRFSFHGVRVRLLDGVPVLEATDGRKLVRVAAVRTQWDEALDDLPPEGVVLDAVMMRDGWKNLRKSEELSLTLEDGRWYLQHGPVRVEVRTLEGEFPKVDAIVPAPRTGRFLTFDAGHLAAVVKATGAGWVTLEVPEFEVERVVPAFDKGPDWRRPLHGQVMQPIYVQVRRLADEDGARRVDDAFGVLMPCSMEDTPAREEGGS